MDSEVWARDYKEIKALGARNNSQRTPEQTEIARFWEATNPIIHVPLVNGVAETPGRDPVSNARLIAVVSMAAADALGAIFDAKYTYNFWRPVTAIRNGDIDGNDATEGDASWLPFVDTPMHPEYPCAHCVVSGTVATLLKAALAGSPSSKLTTTSPATPGKPRSWANPDELMEEVALARIYDGVHYRTSTEVGTAMGVKIGEFAAASPQISRCPSHRSPETPTRLRRGSEGLFGATKVYRPRGVGRRNRRYSASSIPRPAILRRCSKLRWTRLWICAVRHSAPSGSARASCSVLRPCAVFRSLTPNFSRGNRSDRQPVPASSGRSLLATLSLISTMSPPTRRTRATVRLPDR